MKTNWTDIPGFEGVYQVSKDGRVRNLKTSNYSKISEDEFGEKIVWLRYGGKRGKRRIKVLLNLFEDQSIHTRPSGGA